MEIKFEVLRLNMEASSLMAELESLFSGVCNSAMLSEAFKTEIVRSLINEGYDFHLPSTELFIIFDGILRIKYMYLEGQGEGHFVFLFEIPVKTREHIERFVLYETQIFPVSIKNTTGKILELSNFSKFFAINSRYLLKFDNLEECKVTKYGHFCEPKGPLWSRESVCCLTAVMKLDKGYLSECEVLIKDGSNSDKYLKHKGIYYYSVSKERRFSISCENTSLNQIVNLKGLGSIALEQGCTAMSNGVLLVGM